MFDRDFEVFIIKHVRREGAMYCGIMIALGGCAIACIVMAFAAVIRFGFGIDAVSTSLKLLALCLFFTGSCYSVQSVVRSKRNVSREMAEMMNNPECMIPEQYSEEMQAARRAACRILKHIHGLIISYGVLSFTLWAAMALFIGLAIADRSDFILMILVAFVMLAMALPLTILTIVYMMDLPKAHKYKKEVNYVLMEEQTD